MPSRRPLNLLLALLPLLVAAIGWHNPLDALARGKWVRFFDTLTSQQTGTVCLPAQSWEEVPAYAEELPSVVARLAEVGVAAIGVDLPEEHLDVPALRAAAGATPLVLPGDAHLEMRRSWRPRMNLGPVLEGTPLSLAVYRAATGLEPELPGQGDHLLFSPVLIPFHHWDRREEWTAAEGHMVFVGACRADRELTRYGRQPAVVAHGEVVETLLDGALPRYAPLPVDLLLALAAFVGAWRARRRHALLAVSVGGLALGAVMAASLTGTWFGWSGVVVGALCGALVRDLSPRSTHPAGPG